MGIGQIVFENRDGLEFYMMKDLCILLQNNCYVNIYIDMCKLLLYN